MINISLNLDEFLDDAKQQIKLKFHNQETYGNTVGYSRKAINRILNSGEEISIFWIRKLCKDLDLIAENYRF